MRTAVLSVGVLATLTISTGTGRGQEPKLIEDPEAYAVYASVLREEWPVQIARAKRLVIQRETATYNQCIPSGPPMDREWAPVVASFKAENAAIRHVLPDGALNHSYVVVPRTEIAAFFNRISATPAFDNPALGSQLPAVSRLPGPHDGWTTFYDRYPESGGYMQFSAVGFDSTKTRALVYIAHHCGNLCAGGTHYLLEKVDRVWRKAKVPSLSQCMWGS